MARGWRRWIGPTIVIVGAAVAGLGIWYYLDARPQPGEVIDTIGVAEGDGASLIVRAERGGPRAFLELRATSPASGGYTVWQALIPPYAGTAERRGVALGQGAVTVRVVRDGRAEVFAFRMRDGVKLRTFRLAEDLEPVETGGRGPLTLGDGRRSFELVGGRGRHAVIAIDLATGERRWRVDLGDRAPVGAEVAGRRLRIDLGDRVRELDVETGEEHSPKPT